LLDRSTVSLEGKVAVVTGGGGGIGRSISETFAEFGASVVIAEHDERRADDTVAGIEARGGKALACVVDVRVSKDVAAMTETVMATFEHVDILVNNVGDYLRFVHGFLESTEDEWDALYRTNLYHMFLCSRALAPYMVARGQGGSIINVSTIEAFRAVPNCGVYGTFKHAITGFTRNLAVELGPHHIRVNAIAPESTETLQVQTGSDKPHLIPHWVPLGRFGVPNDSAGAALFLASDLSAWTTGSTVHVDGGVLAAAGFFRMPGTDVWTNRPNFEEPTS
jgi:3-oxoacyl-[acyl-carrier protein] reductase